MHARLQLSHSTGRRAVVLAVVILLACHSLAEACPMCKAALASQEGGEGDIVAGFFWSILFMVSMPFLILGSFVTYMYLLVRKARQARDALAVTVPLAGGAAVELAGGTAVALAGGAASRIMSQAANGAETCSEPALVG